MISRIHESLSNTIDCIEMAGGFFASEKTAGVEAGSPLVVFYFPELEKILAQFEKPGEEITRETFEFPGGWRFHFREPGGDEFAMWSDK